MSTTTEADADTALVYDTHDFLLNADGSLAEVSRELPRIREYVQGLPATSSTFRLKQIDDIYQPSFSDIHLEFLKCWRLHDIYAPKAERVYVNPNHVHAHRYSDMVVECDCGAVFTRNYADGEGSLRNEHDHDDDCLPHQRLIARAKMFYDRFQELQRLGKLGWRGAEMAPRFGQKPESMGSLAKQCHTSIQDVYAEYRRVSGNTYAYLVLEEGESPYHIADIYGHAQATMTRWAKEHADAAYETQRGRNQFS